MTSPITNTLTVWHALFLRETLDRFFGSRAGWAWLIVEPMMQLAFMCVIYTYMRGNLINGADLVVWLLVGMLTFFVFRRTAVQTMHSVDCNKAFFAFRQVRPFDAAVARASVEAFSMFLVATICVFIVGLMGKNIIPHDPLLVLAAVTAIWFIGLGYGMITCVLMRLVNDLGHIFTILMLPMYFLSGVIIPLTTLVPQPYRGYLMYNPLAQCVEMARIGFFEHYYAMEVSLPYVYAWVIGLLATGMVMFKLFDARLLTK